MHLSLKLDARLKCDPRVPLSALHKGNAELTGKANVMLGKALLGAKLVVPRGWDCRQSNAAGALVSEGSEQRKSTGPTFGS